MSAIGLILASMFVVAQPADKNTAEPADKNTAPGIPSRITINYAMDSDPLLDEFKATKLISEKYLPLWLQALDRPDADLQRLAAASVAQAHHDGYGNMDKAKPALLRIVSAKESHPAARIAAVRALLELESQEGAPVLWQAAQNGSADEQQLIEPALARWRFQAAYEVWRKRLASSATGHRERMLAIRCLGEVHDLASVPQFLAIARNAQRLDAERLAAAQSAGKTKDKGLESDARQLAGADSRVVDRLCAVNLLEKHDSEAARTLLLALSVDPEPSVATVALRRLNTIDYALVLPLAERAMLNADAGVRREGARCYAALPTLERIPPLGKLLDDAHPGVREMVREDFHRLAADSRWNDLIRKFAMDMLAGAGWRGQEQAALLLAALDHKPAASRLVDLLDSPRGEVMVASAWSLKKLAVPETLPAMLRKATQLTDIRLRHDGNLDPLDHECAHLFEAFALMNHKPAEPLMRRYIPKDYKMGEFSRGAAMWGLGHLHLGQTDEALAAKIISRVTEPASAMPPEMTRVRETGTIALGKMKAKSQAEPLRAFVPQPTPSRLYMAIRWSLKEMNGEEIPLPDAPIDSKGGWFLEPLDALNRPGSK
ncbi:MAG: phycocyanin alpha phycocyanobilin lyase [Planctomycetales bacterium]|nr:phycocyanin alpha phycocyanobilin lyase [Planctomycetales bacterium]